MQLLIATHKHDLVEVQSVNVIFFPEILLEENKRAGYAVSGLIGYLRHPLFVLVEVFSFFIELGKFGGRVTVRIEILWWKKFWIHEV